MTSNRDIFIVTSEITVDFEIMSNSSLQVKTLSPIMHFLEIQKKIFKDPMVFRILPKRHPGEAIPC